MAQENNMRKKYAQLRKEAGQIESRDQNFRDIHDMLVHEANYEFDPKTFMADKKIPKGAILSRLREG